MLFLTPSQQRQSTEGTRKQNRKKQKRTGNVDAANENGFAHRGSSSGRQERPPVEHIDSGLELELLGSPLSTVSPLQILARTSTAQRLTATVLNLLRSASKINELLTVQSNTT